jgi:DNA-binding MarR family transcriptional regulator
MEPAMPAPSPLDRHTGYMLRMVSNAVSHEFARRMAGEDASVAEWAMMRVLYDTDAMPPTHLAERMGMTKGAISKLADRLLARGLIARIANPDDGRAHSLSLTAQGRHLVPGLAAIADRNDADFFGTLSEEEHDALRTLLHTLIARHGLIGTPIA